MNRKISSAQTRRSPDLPENLETLLPVDVKHLEGQTIRDSRGFGIGISGQHFSSLRFVTCLLERMSFANCTIGSCRFRDVRLEKCDLSNAALRGSEATRIELVDCRLDVAMDNPVGVRYIQTICNLNRNLKQHLGIERVTGDLLFERVAFE